MIRHLCDHIANLLLQLESTPAVSNSAAHFLVDMNSDLFTRATVINEAPDTYITSLFVPCTPTLLLFASRRVVINLTLIVFILRIKYDNYVRPLGEVCPVLKPILFDVPLVFLLANIATFLEVSLNMGDHVIPSLATDLLIGEMDIHFVNAVLQTLLKCTHGRSSTCTSMCCGAVHSRVQPWGRLVVSLRAGLPIVTRFAADATFTPTAWRRLVG